MSVLGDILDHRAQEGFNPTQPRGAHGKWIPKVGEKASYYHEMLGRSLDVRVHSSPDARGFMKIRLPNGEPFNGEVRRVKSMMVSQPHSGVPVSLMQASETTTLLGELCEAFTEGLHRRMPKGAAGGGQFMSTGSSGAGVKAVQQRTGATVDGSFGTQTRQSVMAYQRQHGLVVDGVVGHQTAAALQGQKNASSVKIGALTAADRKALGAHTGGTHKASTTKRAKTQAPPKPRPLTARQRAAATSRAAGGIIA